MSFFYVITFLFNSLLTPLHKFHNSIRKNVSVSAAPPLWPLFFITLQWLLPWGEVPFRDPTQDNLTESKVRTVWGDAIRSEISSLKWCRALLQSCEGMCYHDGDDKGHLWQLRIADFSPFSKSMLQREPFTTSPFKKNCAPNSKIFQKRVNRGFSVEDSASMTFSKVMVVLGQQEHCLSWIDVCSF